MVRFCTSLINRLAQPSEPTCHFALNLSFGMVRSTLMTSSLINTLHNKIPSMHLCQWLSWLRVGQFIACKGFSHDCRFISHILLKVVTLTRVCGKWRPISRTVFPKGHHVSLSSDKIMLLSHDSNFTNYCCTNQVCKQFEIFWWFV